MRVVTDIRNSDLIRLQLHFLPRSKGTWIFVGLIALAVVAWAAYSSTGPFTPRKLGIAVISGLIGGIAGLLITTTINFAVLMASPKNKAGVLGHHEYEIRPDGFFERTRENEQLSKWSGIVTIDRTSSFIFVGINDYLFHIIPKRSFSTEHEYDEFFNHLRASWKPTAA